MHFHGITIDLAQVLFALAALVTAWKGRSVAKKKSKGKGDKNA